MEVKAVSLKAKALGFHSQSLNDRKWTGPVETLF